MVFIKGESSAEGAMIPFTEIKAAIAGQSTRAQSLQNEEISCVGSSEITDVKITKWMITKHSEAITQSKRLALPTAWSAIEMELKAFSNFSQKFLNGVSFFFQTEVVRAMTNEAHAAAGGSNAAGINAGV